MKITKAISPKRDGKGKGWILYGNNSDTGKWFERWHETKDKAVKFCEKRSWNWENSNS
jgi:hypothetical protein